MDTNSTLLCQDGMSIDEEEIYVEIAWWLEGVVHLVISTLGFFANSISMSVMLSKGNILICKLFCNLNEIKYNT